MKKKNYYLSPNDNVRSLAPLLRGQVETNTRGIVTVVDPKHEKFVFVEFPEAHVKGWIKATDVEVIPEKWSPEERRRRSSMNKVSAKIRIYPQGYARSLLSDAYDKGLVFDAKVIDQSAGLIRCPEDEAEILIEKYDGKDFGSGSVKVTKVAGPAKKQALDQFGKKYLQNYLKGTGYGEQIMRVACNDVERVLRAEDALTPIALRVAYQMLSKKYTEQGGFKFVRAIRQEVISSGILKRMEG